MLSYTKGTLKTALEVWNRNSDPDFVTELDDIIERGELELLRALDYDPDLSENDTTTMTATGEVFKPDGLLHETELWITVSGVRTPLLKRSRAWIKYVTQTAGTPLYFAELDNYRWEVAPPAASAYLINVIGRYAPASITDGDDNTTTYYSTVMPDLLYIACAIQACEFLKFWSHKESLLAEFAGKVAIFRGETPNNNQTQAADQLGNRDQANPVKGPGQ